MRRLVVAVLRSAGYATRDYSCAEEAIAELASIRPNLAIIDIQMPGAGGLAVVDAIRSDRDLRATPVLVMTGTADGFDSGWSETVGADDLLTKPFATAALRAKVRALLGR